MNALKVDVCDGQSVVHQEFQSLRQIQLASSVSMATLRQNKSSFTLHIVVIKQMMMMNVYILLLQKVSHWNLLIKPQYKTQTAGVCVIYPLVRARVLVF